MRAAPADAVRRAPSDLADRLLGDLGAAASGALVLLGDRLGLYRAMRGAGPLDSVELARRAEVSERYVREWLAAQAASGLVDYDPASGRFALSDEAAELLCGDEGFALGLFEAVGALFRDEPRVAEAFRRGVGMDWHAHHRGLHDGCERAVASCLTPHLDAWLAEAQGVVDRLRHGALVADVGCGSGAVTLAMAQRFPASSVVGFDAHLPSIERARARAAAAGLAHRVRFEVSDARDVPGAGYALVTVFHHLHHLGDPVGALRRAREALAPEGVLLLVEPAAADRLEENFTAAGRLFYAFSALACTPASRSQGLGVCLGAQAGERRLRAVLAAAGFADARTLRRTTLHLALAARAPR